MLLKAIFAFLIVAVYKCTYNFTNYSKLKKFENEYREWIKKPNLSYVKYETFVLRLFKNAGISDKPIVRLMNSRYEINGNFSLIDNYDEFTYVLVPDTLLRFEKAEEVYHRRAKEAFSLFYWTDFILHLPQHAINYIFSSRDIKSDVFEKILNVTWWIALGFFSFIRSKLFDYIFVLVYDFIK